MNIDTAIDRFVFDVGVINKFEYFIPAIYDHLLISMHNAVTRGFGYEYYVDFVNVIQNEPIAFVRRYEAKNDIIFDITDNEIMETIYTMSKDPSSDFINEKIKEFRYWKMTQELKDIVSSLDLNFNDFVAESFPDSFSFLNQLCSVDSSNNE